LFSAFPIRWCRLGVAGERQFGRFVWTLGHGRQSSVWARAVQTDRRTGRLRCRQLFRAGGQAASHGGTRPTPSKGWDWQAGRLLSRLGLRRRFFLHSSLVA
jgi:hypothetical protein